MTDRPTSLELIQAVRHFLEKELPSGLTDPRLRFQALVAAHVLGIVERELPVAETLLAEEARLLEQILGKPVGSELHGEWLHKEVRLANAELCEQVRQGRYDHPAAMRTLGGMLRGLVVRKLEVANPRHLAAVSGNKGEHPHA
jgi:hypothetical protein